ncbi:MAG TPA: hypothetical protein QF353_06015 [Gammaproteobacteria bacterium]|nr:hypothetical protein [Gammaproteobacteria bacterium]
MFKNEFFGYSLKYIQQLYSINMSMRVITNLLKTIPQQFIGNFSLSLIANDMIMMSVSNRTKHLLLELMMNARNLSVKNVSVSQSNGLCRIIEISKRCLRMAFIMQTSKGKKSSYSQALEHFIHMGVHNKYLNYCHVSSRLYVNSIALELLPEYQPIFPFIFRGWWSRWALFKSSSVIILTEVHSHIEYLLDKESSFIQLLPYLLSYKKLYASEIDRIDRLESRLWSWVHRKSIKVIHHWKTVIMAMQESVIHRIYEKLLSQEFDCKELEGLLKHLLKDYSDNSLDIDEIIGELLLRYWKIGGDLEAINNQLNGIIFKHNQDKESYSIMGGHALRSLISERMPAELRERIDNLKDEVLFTIKQEYEQNVVDLIKTSNWDKFYLYHLISLEDDEVNKLIIRQLSLDPKHVFWVNIKYSDLNLFSDEASSQRLNEVFIEWAGKDEFNEQYLSVIGLYVNSIDFMRYLMTKYSTEDMLSILPKLVLAGMDYSAIEYVCDNMLVEWVESGLWKNSEKIESLCQGMLRYKNNYKSTDIYITLKIHINLKKLNHINNEWVDLYRDIMTIKNQKIQEVCVNNFEEYFINCLVKELLNADVMIVFIENNRLIELIESIFILNSSDRLFSLINILNHPEWITEMQFGMGNTSLDKDILMQALDLGLIENNRYIKLQNLNKLSLNRMKQNDGLLKSACEWLKLAQNDVNFEHRYVVPLKASLMMLEPAWYQNDPGFQEVYDEIQSFIKRNEQGSILCQ